ncbi:MAG: dephospho-CoA kinase [Oscillospiraceae bacterium]|nr:dephospho-CoA kinase [Oscillospiraceae bacterium]
MKDFKELNIIGLTGITGAGKSMAAELFKERGFYVINCDKEARRLISSARCSAAVKRAFPEVFDENGVLDRLKTARLVFSSRDRLKEYEGIVFPFITYGLINNIQQKADEGNFNFLLDAPTLYQSGANDLCGKIVAVVASKATCAKRITERDVISEADALMRLNAQPSAEFFKERADYFIENNGDTESYLIKIAETIDKIGKK